MPEQPAGERTEDATPKRRQDARKKGTVAKSTDLIGAIGLLVVVMLAPGVVQNVGIGLMSTIRNVVSRPPTDMTPSSMLGFTIDVAKPLVIACAPLMLMICAAGVATSFSQVGFVLSGESLNPTFEKINPFSGLKRIFSKRSLVEGLKAMAKMCLFGWIAYSAVTSDWGKLVALSTMTPFDSAVSLGMIIHGVLTKIAVTWLVISALDYFFQRKEVDNQLKMTKQELKQEMKEQEGAPELKMAMSQRRRRILKGGLAAKLKLADVLVTNPTHFAVALRYERNEMHAPVVLAKGQDFLALKMREIAGDANIPIVENKPLARALYKQCEPGDFVPRELFTAVAEVLAYVWKSTQKAKAS